MDIREDFRPLKPEDRPVLREVCLMKMKALKFFAVHLVSLIFVFNCLAPTVQADGDFEAAGGQGLWRLAGSHSSVQNLPP